MYSSNNRRAAIKKLKTLIFTSKSETDSFRKKIESTFYNPILPNGVVLNSRPYGNIECDILTPEIYSSRRIILYIHGGSFIGGSRKSWRGFCSSLANICSSRVVVPEFRLAPAHAFPAAVEDIQACFRNLFIEEQIALSLDGEHNPEIIICADGSGAAQALALLFNLREQYKKSIRQIILFSPWINVSSDAEIFKQKKLSDEVLSADCIRKSSDIYTYSSNKNNPFVSPFFVNTDNLKDFPPVFIQMGEKEILLPDVKLFKDKLSENGVSCTLDIWKDMMFMFQMADEYLEESHFALEKIGKLITMRKSEPEDFFADYSISAQKKSQTNDQKD